MKKKLIFLVAVGLLAAIGGCAQSSKKTTEMKKTDYRKISAQEAKKMLDENPVAILLDVRTEAEYKEMHIPNAILLTDSEIKRKAANVLPDKDALILVYCRSGRRSAASARELINMGYTRVYDFGGIIDWPYDMP